jgi:hypothetical protein
MKAETLSWIEEQEPELVRAAEKFVAEFDIHKPDPESRESRHGRAADGTRDGGTRAGGDERNKPRVSASQLRNLLKAAQGRSSLAVLVNFLRYQIGRKRNAWEDKRSGDALVDLLHSEIGKRVESFGCHGRDRYHLESRLAGLFLGFVLREYTYRCREARTSSHD